MKLLIRDYLASLREREELDAILPDLLSELGFHVYSRPQRGTVQHGVDIAAVGLDDNGERKVFLFSVKQGDLTRQDWDGTPQALRSSLNSIQDVYIRHRIPTRYRDLKIVICLAFGGDIQEQVRDAVAGYIADHTTERLSFDEWNGDKIAALLLQGILREEILPKPLRSRFQKTVAMADEPEVSYDHFCRLAEALRATGTASVKARVRAARQLYLCVWILFVWARDANNLEAPYRASELALLSSWELLRPVIGRKSRDARALSAVIMQLVHLHLTVAGEFLTTKIAPHAGVLHGISRGFGAQNATDINLALFEVLGRVGLTGLWAHWLAGRPSCPDPQALIGQSEALAGLGMKLIRNNPALFLPIADRQATDIALFLQLWLTTQRDAREVAEWLEEMGARLNFTVRTRGLYPTCATDYRDLVEHPADIEDDVYFEEATAGSTLIPLLVTWLAALGKTDAVGALATLVKERLPHCTLQLWTPNAESETGLYVGQNPAGTALSNLPLDVHGTALPEAIAQACKDHTGLASLSAMQTGWWPVVLIACRHHHLPVPPEFWIASLHSDANETAAA